MKITTQKSKIEQTKTNLLAIGYWQDVLNKDVQKFDVRIRETIEKAAKQKEFIGEFLQTKLVSTLSTAPFDKLLLIGLGKQKEFDTEKLRKTAATAAILARETGTKSYATNLHSLELNKPLQEKVSAVVESTILALYQFVEYKTIDKDKIKTIEAVELVETENTKTVEEEIKKSSTVANSVCLVRDMVNQPASIMTSLKIAEIAKTLPKSVKVVLHDKKEIQKMQMNALLAVNKGSGIEPRLIFLEYSGSKDKPIALVGKGITFDSGGLDIKPADGMETMKMDMAGAATVIATFKAVAELQLPVHLIAVLPCTENMPGCNAYKPGDIIKAYNGKTIEVINTDAEGRVVLADALSYAETFKPAKIIDLATLTGACIVALGSKIAGIMGTDQKLIQQIKTAGEKVGERVWELPMYEEFKEAVKSEIADVRNIGVMGREGGAITGATFLNAFVEKTPWAHIDIAGPAWSTEDKAYLRKGATGFGVRLLLNFLASHSKT